MKRRKKMLEDAAFNAPLCYSTAPVQAQHEILDEFIERFEAARKRERGDCAKLREALERVLCWLKRMNAEPLNTLAVSELTPSYAVNKTAKSIIEDNDYHISQLTAALDAPPRNCDRFATLPDALAAWRDIDPREAGPFDTWLFALATEQEGGAE
jgi:hypothetical protein